LYGIMRGMKLTLVLHNIRSAYNVGAILRTAEGLGVEKVVLSGYTPRYNDTEILPHLREKLNHQIEKSALGAEKLVLQENLGKNLADLLTFLDKYGIMEGYTLVGLENNLNEAEQARQLILGSEKSREICQKAEKLVLVLGEEVGGIAPEIRAKMEYFLEIPMHGKKESFNVSVAASIAMWGLMCYNN